MGSQNADLLDTLLESTDVEAFGEPRNGLSTWKSEVMPP